MYKLLKDYINRMTLDSLREVSIKNGIYFSDEELLYTYKFLKKNYEGLYANPFIDLSRFKSHYSEENFKKILELREKYSSYLD